MTGDANRDGRGEDAEQARRLVVHGIVQGVNFRAWVGRVAAAEHVRGWAANLPDGTVEVWLQGAPQAVAAVERACAAGPPHAQVARVVAVDAARRDDLSGFDRR